MSASKNADAMANKDGEFGSRVPPSEPLETGGHKPGVLASEKDRAPEFSAQTLPAGSAPAEATYEPNPDLNNQKMYHKASDTLQGADSSAVHAGLGHPGSGQTSNELRHDGQHNGKKQGLGTAGLVSGQNQSSVPAKDPMFSEQRNLGEDVPSGQRGTVGGPAAEERIPESAETVAQEHKLSR